MRRHIDKEEYLPTTAVDRKKGDQCRKHCVSTWAIRPMKISVLDAAGMEHSKVLRPPAPPHRCSPHGEAAGARCRASASTCNHTFRATGITTYLKNGGRVEVAPADRGARILADYRT